MSVCWSVCSRNLKTTRPNFARFFVRVVCGHGSVLLLMALRYFMYFRFCGWRHFCTVGQMGQKQTPRYILKKFVRWRYQLDVRLQRRCLVKFIRIRHLGRSLLPTMFPLLLSTSTTTLVVNIGQSSPRAHEVQAGGYRLYRSLHGTAPQYLSDQLQLVANLPTRRRARLRSSTSTSLLDVRPSRCVILQVLTGR